MDSTNQSTSNFLQHAELLPPSLYKDMMDFIGTGLFVMDASRHIQFVNKPFENMTEYSMYDLHQKEAPFLQIVASDQFTSETIWEQADLAGSWRGDVIVEKKSGETVLYQLDVTVVKEQGRIVYYLGKLIGCPKQEPIVSKLKSEASIDYLTEVANRKTYIEQMNHLLERNNSNAEQHAILFLDLDRFKQVNDTMGHIVGDELLREFTRRVKKVLKGNDLIARLGGDEFIITQTSIQHKGEASILAERILEQMEVPHRYASYEVQLSTSIGISMFPEDGADIQTLLGKADLAMYESKRRGRNMYTVFHQDLEHKIAERHQLEKQLLSVIETKNFSLIYKPKLHLPSQEIRGAEISFACGGCGVSFSNFRDYHLYLEELGLDIPITNMILEQVCQDLSALPDEMKERLSIAIDITGVYFNHPDFVDLIVSIFQKHGVCPSIIELEFDEPAIMADAKRAIQTLQQLKEQGFRLTLDHFGRGFSSISQLANAPLDIMKVDERLVNELTAETSQSKAFQLASQMAAVLNWKVAAEGVRNDEQLTRLRQLGCEYIQGEAVSKPLTFNQFMQLLDTNKIGETELNNY